MVLSSLWRELTLQTDLDIKISQIRNLTLIIKSSSYHIDF